ncbi:hypothetical protein SFC55_03265 [Niallia taxi]|uniref:hypothetical protein n=1 Tax=Niallia taxi TaxID=2499688 RepID=UPI0039826982
MGSEYLFPLLLQANPNYRKILIFTSGIEITIPFVEVENEYIQTPSWLDEDVEENEEAEEEIAVASEEDS